MDIDQILDSLVSYLASCLEDSGNPNAGIIPGVKSVLAGDRNPLDKQQPAITVVWAGEDLSRGSFGLGSVPTQVDFDINLYLGSLPKGDVPDEKVRQLYSSVAGTRGLRAALLSYPGGQGFTLGFGAVRPLRKSEKPDINFSSGLTARVTARALGFR